MKRIDRFGLLASLLAKKQASHGADFEAEREKFHAHLEKFAEPLSFANVLMLAFALSVLFHGKRRSFVEHGVFSLTFLSFVLFSSLLFAVMPALMRMGYRAILMPVIVATLVWQFSYLAVAIRRFYFAADQRRLAPALWATGAAFVIYFLNSAFITAVQILGTAWGCLVFSDAPTRSSLRSSTAAAASCAPGGRRSSARDSTGRGRFGACR